MMQNQGKVHIASSGGGPFRDRVQSGQLLASEIGQKVGKKPVILGIPRGGIVVARELAHLLGGDLDIVLARKLGTPGHEELAMGALAEDGSYFLNDQVVRMLGIPDSSIKEELERQKTEIERRGKLIRKVLPKVSLKNRTVVITDDGAATGATMEAALRAARHENPKKLIAAIPVCSEEAVSRISNDADEVICLTMPPDISAIGQYYYDFTQVNDYDMMKMLTEEAVKRTAMTNLPE